VQTEAAVLTALGQPLELWNLEIPELKSGQILVDVAYSGLCHTQLLEASGAKGPDRFLPHTIGHEGSGVVASVGPDVKKVKTGDRVVLSWIAGSGAVVGSTIYQSPAGRVNSGAISTFIRQAVTCESRVTKIPDEMPLKEAALLGCAVPTGAGIVMNTASLAAGATIAIFGAGGIGLSALLGAVIRQSSMIIVVDVSAAKLAQAQAMGATHLVDATKVDVLSSIREMTSGRGVDCAVEAAGKRQTMEAAFQSVRDAGGLCVLAGNLPQGEMISIDPMNLIKGKRIVGTWGGESLPDRDIPLFVDMYRAGRLQLASLIAQEYPLNGINQAFADLRSGLNGRALISMAQR
jgi:S-(hydroxymethyl)glutathione dehydrogenase/alcohol dehydrogenase